MTCFDSEWDEYMTVKRTLKFSHNSPFSTHIFLANTNIHTLSISIYLLTLYLSPYI